MNRLAGRRRPRRFLIGATVLIGSLVVGCGSDGTTSPTPLVTGDPPTGRRPIIVDTDVDLTDIVALAILLRDPEVDVRAVTITPAGTGVTNCAAGRRVIGYVLDELGADIPFACGRQDPGPDGVPFPEDLRGAADTGWGMTMPTRPQTDPPEDAVNLLARAVNESPSAPTIVALGPWTNIEDALAAVPQLADRFAAIHAMGGAVDVDGNVVVGDITPQDGLEWNFAADPSAVTAVLEATTSTPISLVPLDATDDVPVPLDLTDRLEPSRGAAAGDLTHELLLLTPERFSEGQQLWDELAALALSDPDLVTWEDIDLLAEPNGHLVRDPAGVPIRVATAADRPAVESALIDALARGGPRAHPFTLGGQINARWDGTTCTADVGDGLVEGVVGVTLDNVSGKPGGVLIAGVRAPHDWSELLALVPNLDVTTTEFPDWVIQGGGANDDAGSGEPVSTMMRIEAGTYGPICVAGLWPDPTFTPGQPFEVSVGG